MSTSGGRCAPRALVAREVALQVVAAGTNVTVSVGDGSAVTALLTVLTAVVLLVRLRWPASATLAAGGLLPFAAPGLWLAAALSASSAGRRETSAPRLWGVVASSGLLCVAATPLALGVQAPGVQGLGPALGAAVVGVALLLVLPATCSALVGRRRPAARLLAERNAYLERARTLTVDQARWEERGRITAEMHDVLGHRLSLLSIHAGALEVRVDARAPELSDQARLVRTSATAALDELRATLAATSASADAPPPADAAAGSPAGVLALVDHWRSAGAEVSMVREGAEALDPRVGRVVDRTVREGLTNAHKHAPGTAVALTVRCAAQQVVVSITNAAPARSTPAGPGTGLGLLGLAERARLVGGHATWGATHDGGFGLVVVLSAQPAAAPALGLAVTREPPALVAPPTVRAADVLTWRRAAVVGVVAVALPLAVVLSAGISAS